MKDANAGYALEGDICCATDHKNVSHEDGSAAYKERGLTRRLMPPQTIRSKAR